MGDKPLIAILLTCFNRRETTLACLASIEAAVAGSADYRIVIVDDGSSDGTADAVRAAFPDAMLVIGSGNLY
jgi:glycosyltransferase involved in cell wall biosynthesis